MQWITTSSSADIGRARLGHAARQGATGNRGQGRLGIRNLDNGVDQWPAAHHKAARHANGQFRELVSEPQSGSRVTASGTTAISFVTTYEATVSVDAIVGRMTSQSQNKQPTAVTPGAARFEGKREKR